MIDGGDPVTCKDARQSCDQSSCDPESVDRVPGFTLNGQGFTLKKVPLPLLASLSKPPLLITLRTRLCMARKGATATDGYEPRRSSRIKDQVKPDPLPKKAPAKPRTRKPKATGEDGDAADKEKPKSASRGKKRTSAEKEAESAQPAVNGGEDASPPAKKVNFRLRAHLT
jgi:hypothetical protein